MWVASKPFRYRGISYKIGDQVPAETWPGRKGFISLRRIRFVDDPQPVLSEISLTTMKRAELDEFAKTLGMDNPSEYKNRDSLIEKLEEIRKSPNEIPPQEIPLENASAVVEEDDPFADLKNNDSEG